MKLLRIAKKSLGQNFLIDNNIINKIIKIGDINENKIVMEIGPGYGNLTKGIASMKPKKILAIENETGIHTIRYENKKGWDGLYFYDDLRLRSQN